MNDLGPLNLGNFDYSEIHFPNPLYVDRESVKISNPLYVDLNAVFPALQEYKVLDRSLNAKHLQKYGNQEIFQTETKASVRYVLSEIHKAVAGGNFNERWFYTFLGSLGKMRGEIAELLNPNNEKNKDFGLPRIDEGVATPIIANGGSYSGYAKRVNDLINNNNPGNFIKVDVPKKTRTYTHKTQKETFKLSCADNPGYFESIISKMGVPTTDNTSNRIYNVYNKFWDENDPVFKKAFSMFKKIVKDFHFSKELKDEIADFHWLFANVAPFFRGSAWCGEVLTDACWLYHDYVPSQIEEGKSLDLEALTLNQEDFRNIYPMGRSVQ